MKLLNRLNWDWLRTEKKTHMKVRKCEYVKNVCCMYSTNNSISTSNETQIEEIVHKTMTKMINS